MIVLRAVRVDDETGTETELGDVRLTDGSERVFAFSVPGCDRSGFVERLREKLAAFALELRPPVKALPRQEAAILGMRDTYAERLRREGLCQGCAEINCRCGMHT